MIKVVGIKKKFKNGTIANDNISFEISKGDLLGIIGSNGAGKTTLVRQIVGLSAPTSGEIIINDTPVKKDSREQSKQISFFNQNTILLEAQTAFEVVFFAGVFRGVSRKLAATQAMELLDYFDLEGSSKKRLALLSGGQRKLVMLAATFIGRYPVIILDEPTNDLDPQNRFRLWKLIKEYNENYGTTFIVVSHNLSELETIARKILIIENGRVLDFGDLQTIKNRYSKGYSILIKCEYEHLKSITEQIGHPYIIENQREVVLRVEDKEFLSLSQGLLPLVMKYNAEMQIYQNTLSNVYQAIQEANR